MKKQSASQAKLKKDVLEQGLCTGCGACVGLCPYQVIHCDRTVQLFDCDLSDGKCHAFCPRTPWDYAGMREKLFSSADLTPEIGAVAKFVLTRAADPDLRARAQHGGTVTALMEAAMSGGMIDAAFVAAKKEALEQEGKLLFNQDQLRAHAKSRFTVSPVVAAFNRLEIEDGKRVAVVATPCQALALAKMKTADMPDNHQINRLHLVIGLFCGWTLALEKFQNLLKNYGLCANDLSCMDIPAGKNVLELQTAKDVISVPMVEVEACVRTACRYCLDSTAEFADLSVGAARFGGSGDEMRGWNQLIVRSSSGKDLLNMAVAQGKLEVREAPGESLQNLKNAAATKKQEALKNIVEKSRSAKNLLYLSSDDPVVRKYLK